MVPLSQLAGEGEIWPGRHSKTALQHAYSSSLDFGA